MALTRKTPMARRGLKRGGKGLKRGGKLKPVGEAGKRRKARYAAFMRSHKWKVQRARVIERDGGQCTQCRATERLQAHHVRYGSPIEATPDRDIVTLCYGCHERVEAELRPWNRGR